MKDRMDQFVMRVKPSQKFSDLAGLFDQEHPGIAEHADRLYACVSLAGTIVDDHPDLSKSNPAVQALAVALFSATTPVVELTPEGEGGEEDRPDDGRIRPGKIEVCDPQGFSDQ